MYDGLQQQQQHHQQQHYYFMTASAFQALLAAHLW